MAIGTTIDGLNTVTSLTAQDEVPVWDAEASNEPTKKITAAQFAAAVKVLANLQGALIFDDTPTKGSENPVYSGGIFNAIAQSTEKLLLANSTTVLRVGANPSTGNPYASIRFIEDSSKWTELIFNENGIAMRRTENGGSNFTNVWTNH